MGWAGRSYCLLVRKTQWVYMGGGLCSEEVYGAVQTSNRTCDMLVVDRVVISLV
jgi:hypothetical protein